MRTDASRPRLAALALAAALACGAPARAQDPAQIPAQMVDAINSGQLPRAAQLARRGIEVSQAQGDTLWVGTFMTKLGLVLHIQGKNREAEPVLRQAVDLSERSVGPDDAWISTILQFLGAAIHAQGRYAEAEQIYRPALDVAGKQRP